MKNLFQNKAVVIVLVVILLLVVGAGAYYFVAGNQAAKTDEDDYSAEEIVETLSPDAIGLTIEANPSGKAIKFLIAQASGIESIEYQVTYEADSTAEEQREGGEPRVQRGITGEAMVKSGGSSYESEWLDLGSCSRNVCRYDTGVTEVLVTLKIVKADGKIYHVEQTLEL